MLVWGAPNRMPHHRRPPPQVKDAAGPRTHPHAGAQSGHGREKAGATRALVYNRLHARMRRSAHRHAIPALLVALSWPWPAHGQDALDEPPETTLARDAEGGLDAPEGPSDEEADRKARALFERGRVAYDDGRYRDAWDYFHQAYVLSKRPQLLYNVGQAADRLRLDQQALDAFRLYLKKLPEADNRREVENRIAALEARLAESGQPTEGDGAAASEAPTEDPAQAPEAIPPGGQPTRSGWAFRGALGLGVFGNSIDGLGADASVGSSSASVHAIAGYGLAPGLIVGAGFLLDAGLAPNGELGPASGDLDDANIVSGHALVDYYFSPRKHGWHVLGGLGVANIKLSDSALLVGNRSASGGAAIVGVGLDFPFGREWAIGVLGRVLLARMEDGRLTHVVFAPNIAFTGIWY